MRRFHLIEFHEQSWVPRIFREGVTDYLRTATEVAGQYSLVVPILQEAFSQIPQSSIQVVDLGSGAGGGWLQLYPMLKEGLDKPLSVQLSDYSPNIPALEEVRAATNGEVQFIPTPVDARHVPVDWKGIRTLFNVFHHFQPSDARAILADAHDKRQPIVVIEALDNSWLQAIMILILAPILVLLLTPRIRPFRIWRIIFTYLIPILPLMIAWDGFVSILRLHSPEAMGEMVEKLDGFTWDYGKTRKGNLVVIYLKGIPK